jgi:hypothetical protein
MDEQAGRSVLRARFEAAGLSIADDVALEVDGHPINVDGYDAARRIGYEYLTRAEGDLEEFRPEVVQALERRAASGDLVLFLIDEDDVAGPEELGELCDRFLAELRARGRLA